MEFTTRVRYALRIMLELAEHHGSEQPLNLLEVSSRTGISRRYMDQILRPLRNIRLVVGIKGPSGGYRLLRPPEEVRLLEIIEAQEGRIEISPCLGAEDACERAADCCCTDIYALASARLRKTFHDVTLAELCDPAGRQALQAATREIEETMAR